MDNNIQHQIIPFDDASKPQIHFAGSYGEASRDINLRDYWDIVRKRKLLVLLFFIGVVSIVGLATFLMTPIYRASATLQITQDNPASLVGERDPLAALSASETQGRFYETQYMLLGSRSMAYRIIDSLKLDETPEYQNLRKRMKGKSANEIRIKYADSVLANLDVKPLKRSYLVEVAYHSPDKELAQNVVNVISSEYMKYSMDTRRQSYDLIKNWLEGELLLLARKVEESERKVYEHGKQKEFLSLEEGKDNVTINKYVELGALLTRAQAERLVKEALHKQIKEKGADAPAITNNALIQKLRADFIEQQAKVSSLNKIYDVNYPQLQAERGKLNELRARLDNEVKRIRASIDSDYGAALKAESLLQEALNSQKHNVGDLQQTLVKHHILKRDMQTNEQLYQALLARMKETSVSSTMVASNVAVVSPAELPYRPYKPTKRLNMILACFFGLTGGIGLAFLCEYLDDSIKTVAEMERACRLPLLGVIPLLGSQKLEDKTELSLISFNRPRSYISEAVRQVRTSIMLSASGGAPGAILVTSANPSEGKSTLCINLAISLAMNNCKVVLMDCDLRKPGMHKIFKLDSQPGLSNFLTGNAPKSEIIRPTEVPNLFLIPAGPIPPSPAELLNSKLFKDLLMSLRMEFQHLVIDSPPLIEFADARIMSTIVDGTLLVVRNHYTTRKAGSVAKQLLNQVNARVIGGILNMTTANRLGYGGYYYGYDKYHSKYYKNYDASTKSIDFDT
jgi:succinoglycan biosynthesis transport protein ExoP